MLQCWVVGAVVCFLLCFYLVIDCRRYVIHDYPIWYDVFFGIIAGAMLCCLSWVAVIFLLMVLSIPRND